MRLLSFLIFLSCLYSPVAAELPYLTSENDTLFLIEGIVDVYNGIKIPKDRGLRYTQDGDLFMFLEPGRK